VSIAGLTGFSWRFGTCPLLSSSRYATRHSYVLADFLRSEEPATDVKELTVMTTAIGGTVRENGNPIPHT
jgi:hypothetical protein